MVYCDSSMDFVRSIRTNRIVWRSRATIFSPITERSCIWLGIDGVHMFSEIVNGELHKCRYKFLFTASHLIRAVRFVPDPVPGASGNGCLCFASNIFDQLLN